MTETTTLERPEQAPAPRAGGEPLIELRHVSKSYATADGGSQVTILDDVNLEVHEGEMLALLGQSGCGKSTILRLMAGLTDPTQGAVLSHGAPLDGVNPHLALVFQSFALYPWLTVEQNVEVGLIDRRLTPSYQAEEISRVLELIGLSGYGNAYPKQLSGGMRQRVGFARAIVARPEVLCMDEAFSALDVLTAENLRAEVVDLWRNSSRAGIKSIFFVTHNIAEAVYMASRIVIISSHPGRIRHVIHNALPYPRDVNSPGFAAMVDQIHAAITSLALPDEPAEAPAKPVPSPALEAAVTTVTTPPPVRTRVESIPAVPVNTIFGLAIMKLKLFQIVTEKLAAAPDGRLPAEVVLEDLATLLPYDYPEKLFETLIAWGRYAEILDYNEKSKTIMPQESDADEDEETQDVRRE